MRFSRRLETIGLVFLFGAFVFLVCFFINGETIVSGSYIESEKSDAVVCVGNNLKYPIFMNENPDESKIEINLIFNGEDARSISLRYSGVYSSRALAGQALVRMNAEMNDAFGAELGADAYGAHYSVLDSVSSMGLYVSGNYYGENAKKFFMIYGDPRSSEEYKLNYESQGFICDTI